MSDSPLMTFDEAIKYLRLDERGLKNPRQTIYNLRHAGKLLAVRVAGHLMFTKADLDAYIEYQKS